MKYLLIVFAATLIGCSDGGEQVEGRTTPATDPSHLQSDSVKGSRLEEPALDRRATDTLR
ncbi:MAG TPA: hypothetical protein VGN63_12295 [Flavisolibacter sp.]|jgi:hypothetical protein|nr:hypothetical protein [Flavisolibacter sp.]